MNAGDRIRLIRKQNGMNQTEFAGEIGISTTSVCCLEIGKYQISRATKRSLCRRFHVNPEWLETGEGEQYVESNEIMTEDMDRVLKENPSVLKVFTRAVRIFSDEDWRKIDFFLESLSHADQSGG